MLYMYNYIGFYWFRQIYSNMLYMYNYMGFSLGSDVKESACNAGDPGSISGSGRSPEEGNGNPL